MEFTRSFIKKIQKASSCLFVALIWVLSINKIVKHSIYANIYFTQSQGNSKLYIFVNTLSSLFMRFRIMWFSIYAGSWEYFARQSCLEDGIKGYTILWHTPLYFIFMRFSHYAVFARKQKTHRWKTKCSPKKKEEQNRISSRLKRLRRLKTYHIFVLLLFFRHFIYFS